jgi:phosphoribosylglycinamide formyltransferase-1
MIKTEQGILRLGVLISGRGSNLKAILEKQKLPENKFKVVVVISNVLNAPGVAYSHEHKIPTYLIRKGEFPNNIAYERCIKRGLKNNCVDLIVLAGYMSIVGETLLNYRNIVNIHPSLLPSFPGLNAQKQALQHGVKITGCTVHHVDEGMDTGHIIKQAAVEVLENDTEETLGARILEKEHQIYSEAIQSIVKRTLVLEDFCKQ